MLRTTRRGVSHARKDCGNLPITRNQNPPFGLSRGLRGALPMPKKRNATRKVATRKVATRKAAAPKCAVCADTMKLKRVIPAAHIFPELKTFQCAGCGNLRTVEDERELVAPEAVRAAA